MAKLTKAQEAQMKEHKKRHTAKCIKEMRTAMGAGKSFKAAHIFAKKMAKSYEWSSTIPHGRQTG